MKLSKPYKREEVLARLARHGIRPVYVEADARTATPRYLSHLEAVEQEHIGLTLWSYIDSLGVRLVRV